MISIVITFTDADLNGYYIEHIDEYQHNDNNYNSFLFETSRLLRSLFSA